MLNFIWVFLLVSGVITAVFTGRLTEVGQAVFSACNDTVAICIGLVGVMTLWMGILKLVEAAGMVQALARLSAPLVGRLFPDIPKNDPALSAIVMNISANLLGLGNAATPFGLKAMEELQRLNRDKTAATPAMITFLVINTCSLTLLPAMVIALRSQAGSSFPEEIILPTVIAGLAALTLSLLLDRLLRRLYFGS